MQFLFIKKYKKLGAKIIEERNIILSIKIKELPELERPYEKLELYGEKSLSNAELLAIIIKTGTKEETSVQLAQKLLNLNKTTKDDLNYLHTLSLEELMQIKGIGKVKAIQLKAVGEIAIRMFSNVNYLKTKIRKPEDVAKILASNFKFETNELVKVIVLNTQNEVLKIKNVAMGGSGFANVLVRDILVEPIKMRAPKYILVHNHPGGSVKPSKADIKFTEKLYELSKLYDLELLDHIIIAGNEHTSILSQWLSDIN